MKRHSLDTVAQDCPTRVLDAAISTLLGARKKVNRVDASVYAQLAEPKFPAVVACGRRYSFDLVAGTPCYPRDLSIRASSSSLGDAI